MRAAFLLVALLAGCRADTAFNAAANEEVPATANASQTAGVAEPEAKAFSAEEENDLYSFKYSWSKEAAAVPQLVEQFTKDMEKQKAETISTAREDRYERKKQDFPFNPYDTQKSYETAGQSDRLLSLGLAVYAFTGGAHGSSGSGSLLWDRQLAREVSIQDLLQSGQSWTGAVRQPFCIFLNREREKRRGEPVKPDDLFGDCPKYGDVTVLLADDDKNGRFDHIQVIADQYVAGPYAEGPYEISLPITAAMIERLKPEYRASFEPRPPVK